MTLSPAEIGLTAAVVLLLFALAAVLLLKTRNGSANEAVLRAQSELSGRLAQFSEHYALEQDKLARLLAEQKLSVLQMIDEKLLLITRKVGEGLQMSAGKTDETLGALRERLANRCRAGKNLFAFRTGGFPAGNSCQQTGARRFRGNSAERSGQLDSAAVGLLFSDGARQSETGRLSSPPAQPAGRDRRRFQIPA